MTVIINPGDGPGVKLSSTYATWVVNLRAAGINVLGYVYTSFGARSASSIKTDIATYKSWYGINGIFVDEMSNKVGYESYYTALTAYAHSEGFPLVVGNPGTSVPRPSSGRPTWCSPSRTRPSPLCLRDHDGGPAQERVRGRFIRNPVPLDVLRQHDGQLRLLHLCDQRDQPRPVHGPPVLLSTLVSDVKTFLSTTTPLTVQAADVNGKAVTGLWTTVSLNGNVVDEGYTPLSFLGTTGDKYAVSVPSFQSSTSSTGRTGARPQRRRSPFRRRRRSPRRSPSPTRSRSSR